MKKVSVEVKLGKVKLRTPVVCASGTFGFGEELKGLVDFGSIGAIATKTITLKPREGNPAPRIYETDCGVINSVGLQNPGVDVFVKEKLPRIRKLATKCIVSIGGETNQEYAEIAKRLRSASGVDAVELNLSCPNIKSASSF